MSQTTATKYKSFSSISVKIKCDNYELSLQDYDSNTVKCKYILYNLKKCIANEPNSFPRKKSKISIQMEKLGNELKKNDQLIQNDINEEDSLSILDNFDNSEFENNEENKNNFINNIKRDIFKKFKVYFFF